MSEELPRIFYDGSCGVCHKLVRFFLQNMQRNTPLIFSPIDGKSYRELLGHNHPSLQEDSILVFDPFTHQLLSKGEAVIFISKRLKKKYRICFSFLRVIPKSFLNVGYDLFAKLRKKIFSKPHSSCPALPKHLRKFLRE